jgi:hypothetical protein
MPSDISHTAVTDLTVRGNFLGADWGARGQQKTAGFQLSPRKVSHLLR